MFITVAKGGFFVRSSVRPSVRQRDYFAKNERICMEFLPEVCLGPEKKSIEFRGWSDYDSDPGSGGRGLQSLTDCLVLLFFFRMQT